MRPMYVLSVVLLGLLAVFARGGSTVSAAPGTMPPAPAPVVPGSAALGAAPLTLSCSGAQLSTFTPGKTETPQSITIQAHALFTSCTLSPADDDPIVAGETSVQLTDPAAVCEGQSKADPYQETFHWKTAQGKDLSSLVDFDQATVTDQNSSSEELKVQVTGEVLSGVGEGDRVVKALDLTDPDPAACQTPGGLQVDAGSITVEFQAPSLSESAAPPVQQNHLW